MAEDNYKVDEIDSELQAIHETAMEDFDEIATITMPERNLCLEDREFATVKGMQFAGEMWEGYENKPKIEVNKVHLSGLRIINEYRNNRISVAFVSREGVEYDQLADRCAGLYRADELDSCADEAYDNAFEEAVWGGFGAFRYRTEYEDQEDYEDEKQRIRIEPIFDADRCVFFDLNAKRQDKSDAKFCFVLNPMTRESYFQEYDEDPVSFPISTNNINQQFDWVQPDIVYVAEYYKVEMVKEVVYAYTLIDGTKEHHTKTELEANPDIIKELEATGAKLTSKKNIKQQKVHKYIINGQRVLEDCGYIAGTQIPIVPVYGKRWYINNIERYMGCVRLAKDAQRLKNMQLSKLAEISSISSAEIPIVTPEQIAGHQQDWADANIKNLAYLQLNPVMDSNGQMVAAPPIGYTKPPSVPPALAALMQIAEQDMQEILGNQQAGEILPNQVSGRAIELVQNKIDMQAYIYVDNMKKAIKRGGQIWLAMAKDVYVEPNRKMKSVSANGQSAMVEIARPVMNEEGEIEYENDLSSAKFDIAVEVGASSSSRKAATVRNLMGMMQLPNQSPQDIQVLSNMAMMNMEGEGLEDARAYYRKNLLRMGIGKPTDAEQEELMAEAQNQQPNAQDQYFVAAAVNEQAKAQKAQADTVKTVADAEKIKVETAQTVADMSQQSQTHFVETLGKVKELTSPAVNAKI